MTTHKAGAAVAPWTGDFAAAAALEVDAGEAAALSMTADVGAYGATGTADLVYTPTAEDNGTAGEMDGQPGLVASGIPVGIRVPLRVSVRNLDISEGTIAPEATDRIAAVVSVNSSIDLVSEQGFVAADVSTEHTIDGTIYVAQNDVVRFAVLAATDSEDALDIAVAERGEVTLS